MEIFWIVLIGIGCMGLFLFLRDLFRSDNIGLSENMEEGLTITDGKRMNLDGWGSRKQTRIYFPKPGEEDNISEEFIKRSKVPGELFGKQSNINQMEINTPTKAKEGNIVEYFPGKGDIHPKLPEGEKGMIIVKEVPDGNTSYINGVLYYGEGGGKAEIKSLPYKGDIKNPDHAYWDWPSSNEEDSDGDPIPKGIGKKV